MKIERFEDVEAMSNTAEVEEVGTAEADKTIGCIQQSLKIALAHKLAVVFEKKELNAKGVLEAAASLAYG